jgi:hypothetical protein
VDVNRKFVEEMANPHAWLLTAENLHEQAVALYDRRGRGTISLVRPGQETIGWDRTNRSVFLLGGFALENAIKAFLVYENPQWISNGRLARDLKSHSLTGLQKQSGLIPFKRRYVWVFDQFEDGLESWARYPCGLTAETSQLEGKLQDKLWAGYLRVMEAYGKRLRVLLSGKVWHGPHRFSGRWTFEDF